MERKIIASRIRQLLAVDQNAYAIYAELAQEEPKESLRAVFSNLANQEQRHCLLEKELLLLLEK